MDYETIAEMLDKTFAWSLSRTFSGEEAEELTQEILLQALQSVNRLRDDAKFEAWFWRLADITLKVFKRGKAKARSVMSFDEVAAVVFKDEYPFETDEIYQNLRQKIVQMSAAYREMIVMYYYDNLSCKTISQTLKLPEGTVTYRLSQARKRLKESCEHMTKTALKPAVLKIRITGEGNYNGDDKPFPWQYIDDALSQNILWHSYREPQTVEGLSALTGVPAFYIEDRICNLIKREAVIQPTQKTVQTNFLIFDQKINDYAPANAGPFAGAVAEEFYRLSRRLTDEMISAGLHTAGRSKDEIQCLLSSMLLDTFVPEYRPTKVKRYEQRYDGGRWDYTGFYQDGSCGGDVGISMEKSMNSYDKGKLAHYTYHFAPFAHRKMMFSEEIDVCHAVLHKIELTNEQKEYAANMMASGYLTRDNSGKITCTLPIFTKEQHTLFITLAKTIFADFLPFYAEEVGKYLDGYIKLFPKHLKDATERNGFHVFVALLKAVVKHWIKNEGLFIKNGAVCDGLIAL